MAEQFRIEPATMIMATIIATTIVEVGFRGQSVAAEPICEMSECVNPTVTHHNL
jgi:hypothetical protein|eukprot:COSAG06_NODE_1_length_58652_cov_31.600967_25_plen_54_part_00